MVEFITYIPYSEIFGSSPNEQELNKTLKTFKKLPAFAFLSSINLLLSLFVIGEDSDKVQKLLINNLISKEVLEVIKNKFRHEKIVKRPLFHRQQILTLIKKVLLESPYDGNNDPNSENWEESENAATLLGQASLMINDLLVSAEQSGNLRAKDHTEKSEGEVLDEFLVQWLPVVELMNPPQITNAIARSEKYFEIFESEFSLGDNNTFSNGLNTITYFFDINKISLRNYLKLIYSVYAFYFTQNFETYKNDPAMLNFRRSEYFLSLQLPQSEIDSFFNFNVRGLSGLINELQNSASIGLLPQYDFIGFRQYPLVELNDDIITCIDVNFLIEKLSFGVYHAIFNSFDATITDRKKDRNLFSSLWGKVFEHYVNFLFSQSYPPLSGRLISFAKFLDTNTDQEAFDGVIDSGDKLIVMEYKGGFLNASAKYSGSKEKLLGDLDKKYGSQHKGGIEQLVRKIELVFNSDYELRKTFDGFDKNRANDIKVIYPVLIVKEHALNIGLATNKLRRVFDEQIKNKNISSSIFIRPLSVLLVEDLEILLPYIDEGKISFADFLEEYTMGNHDRLENFQSILKKFRKENNVESCPNKWINEQHEKILNSIRALVVESDKH